MTGRDRIRSWLSTPAGVWVVRALDVAAIGTLAAGRLWLAAAGYAVVLTIGSNPLPTRCADCDRWSTSTARLTTTIESEHGTAEFVRTCCASCASVAFGAALDAGYRPPPPNERDE